MICANHQHSYEKRRTILLSQYLGPEFAAQLQHDLRESPTASEPSGSRTASFAQQPSGHAPGAGAGAGFDPRASIASSNFEYAPSPANSSLGGSTQYMAYPPRQVGRFQEKQLGLRTASMDAVRAAMQAGGVAGVAEMAGRLVVPAAEACGLALFFAD